MCADLFFIFRRSKRAAQKKIRDSLLIKMVLEMHCYILHHFRLSVCKVSYSEEST